MCFFRKDLGKSFVEKIPFTKKNLGIFTFILKFCSQINVIPGKTEVIVTLTLRNIAENNVLFLERPR